MKVLWIIHGGESFGERRAVCSLMKGVRASGWEVEAASLTRGECSEALLREGIPVVFMQAGDSPGMHRAGSKMGRLWQLFLLFGHQVGLMKPIRHAIRGSGADVVHVLDKNILPAVAWAARKEGKPCFWEMTAAMSEKYPYNLNQRLHATLVRGLHIRPLANSHNTAAPLRRLGCPVDVMYLGVDDRIFDPARNHPNIREELGIPADSIVFTIVARTDPLKGQQLFLDALVEVNDPRIHLVLVGMQLDHAETLAMQAMARRSTMAGRVHFVGFTPHPETYLANSDVAVNAYTGMEGFGLSTVEGMMMEKPLLVHALGGPAETVVDQETGWHMAGATVKDFSAGIRRALTDRRRWKAMGAAGRARAMALYSLETQTRRYRALVEGAMAERKVWV